MQKFLNKMARTAVIVGASGLIGRKLLNILLQWPDYDQVISIGRKKIQLKSIRLKQLVVDFDHLELYEKEILGDAFFCCLGTTRHKTPDLNKYRQIDHDYPVALAKIAKKNGITQYHFVSAIGADKGSSTFYTRLKGETEEDIKAVVLDSLYIYQPSILTGYRNDRRILEEIAILIMKVINPLLFGSLKKYRSISAYTVAIAMFKQSLKSKEGVFTYPSDKIKKLA